MTVQEEHGFTLYHVYFSGLKREGLETNFLLTYDGNKAPGLDKLLAGGHKGKLFMDSGAFPAAKKNTDLDIDKYIRYVNTVGDNFDAIAQLDYLPRVADGSVEERTKKSIKLTWERFQYMWERVRPELRDKLIYVLHGSEDIEEPMRRALSWRDSNGNKIRYLGVGLSNPDREQRARQLEIVNKLFKEYEYDGRFHGFGLQILDLVQLCPYLTSCDSSSAIRDQMQGNVFIEGQSIKVSDDTKVHHHSVLTMAQKELLEPKLRARAEELGIDFDLAKINAQERYIWGCKERDLYITSHYGKHHKRVKGNLLSKK